MTVPLEQALTVAKDLLVRTGDMAQGSLDTYFTDWDHFVAYATRFKAIVPAEIDAEVVARWLQAPDSTQNLPVVASQHRRRASVRKLFACWRALDIIRPEHNPTSNLPLPPRSTRTLRPLETDEIDSCRWASRDDGNSTRYPAVWALAEAGATTTELTEIRSDDVDLDEGTVLLPGGSRLRCRTAPLTPWGVLRLREHLSTTAGPGDRHLVYGHQKLGGRRSTLSNVIDTIFDKAGLGDEPDVRAESIRAWIGRDMRDNGEPIEAIALRLGMHDLNKAMVLIGEDWEAEGE